MRGRVYWRAVMHSRDWRFVRFVVGMSLLLTAVLWYVLRRHDMGAAGGVGKPPLVGQVYVERLTGRAIASPVSDLTAGASLG